MNLIRLLATLVLLATSAIAAGAVAEETLTGDPLVRLGSVRARVPDPGYTIRARLDRNGRVEEVVIEMVFKKSLAADEGLKRGMEILAINGTPLKGMTAAELEALKPAVGPVLELLVKRSFFRKPETISIPLQ